MSEPYALLLSLPYTDAAQFRAAYDGVYPDARAYDDWAAAELEASAEVLGVADKFARFTPRRLFDALAEDALAAGDWRFEIDAAAQRFTFVQLMGLSNAGEILGALSVLRGFAGAAAPWVAEAPGVILVHDYVFETHGTQGAIYAGGGGSALYGADTPQVPALVASFQPLAEVHRAAVDGGVAAIDHRGELA